MKTTTLLLAMLFFTCLGYAQRIDKQTIFVATSEEEVYKLYDQMLDSLRITSEFLQQNREGLRDDNFVFGYFEEIEGSDTIMKFVQNCKWQSDGEYICRRFYRSYISNSMPIDFYERFLKYLKQLDKIENYFIKGCINTPLFPIIDIIEKLYESGNLNKEDSIKARRLIEETILRLINDNHNYRGFIEYKGEITYDKYMTDKIRQALVNIIKNPFYPKEYLDLYMSLQDTVCVDTTGIPAYIRTKSRWKFTAEEWAYAKRLDEFELYEEIGKEEYNGLSAGQAYLQRKKEKFREKGYLPIKYIADYAYQKNDKLLIKHLEKFKKKHLEEYNKQQPSYLQMK